MMICVVIGIYVPTGMFHKRIYVLFFNMFHFVEISNRQFKSKSLIETWDVSEYGRWYGRLINWWSEFKRNFACYSNRPGTLVGFKAYQHSRCHIAAKLHPKWQTENKSRVKYTWAVINVNRWFILASFTTWDCFPLTCHNGRRNIWQAVITVVLF